MKEIKITKLTIFLIIVLFAVTICFVYYVYKNNNQVSKNEASNVTSTNNTNLTLITDLQKQISEKDEIITKKEAELKELKEKNEGKEENKKEESTVQIKEKLVYLVEDAFYKYDGNAAKSTCGDSNESLYIKARVPKINIDSKVVKKINDDILKKYNNLSISTSKGGYDIDVNYEYKYAKEKELLLVIINERYNSHCATGSYELNEYIYDIKNDKLLTKDDVLKLYDISKKHFKELAYDYLKDYLEDNRAEFDVNEYNEYKSRLDRIIDNSEYEIDNITNNSIDVKFRVDLVGFKVTY